LARSFQLVLLGDFNMPTGFHVNEVQLLITIGIFTLFGPVTFSGAAYALTNQSMFNCFRTKSLLTITTKELAGVG
jgi:hypothetical protein